MSKGTELDAAQNLRVQQVRERDARIATLEAEVAAMREQRNLAEKEIGYFIAEVAALRAEVEGMREGIAQLVERWAVIHDGADFDCDALVDEIRAYKESSK